MRFIVSLILLLLISMPTHAVQVENLYSTQEFVQTQTKKERDVAIRRAISRVAIKVTGRQGVLQNTDLQKALANIDAYIEQFQYAVIEGQANGYKLQVTFQKAAIDRTLEQFGIPVWGANRPAVMVWLAVESGGRRYLIGEGTHKTSALLQRVANDVGLPVILPSLDLQDQRAVDFNDVWGMFSERVIQASTRYGAKHVVLGRLLKERDNSWKIRWSFINNKGQDGGESRELRLSDSFATSLRAITSKLADIYAPRGDKLSSEVVLHVSGIKGLSDFSRVAQYLEKLNLLKAVRWQRVMDTKASFVVSLSGGLSGLKELIALNKVLEEDVQIKPVLPVLKENVGTKAELPNLDNVRQELFYRVR